MSGDLTLANALSLFLQCASAPPIPTPGPPAAPARKCVSFYVSLYLCLSLSLSVSLSVPVPCLSLCFFSLISLLSFSLLVCVASVYVLSTDVSYLLSVSAQNGPGWQRSVEVQEPGAGFLFEDGVLSGFVLLGACFAL
jgi:hypothetical protein